MLMRVPPDQNMPLPKFKPQYASNSAEDYLPNATPIQTLAVLSDASRLPKEQSGMLSVQIDEDLVVLPDFRGLSKRNVLSACIDIGVRLQSKGSGVAVSQSPPPGTRIPEGETCTVTFAKVNAKGASILSEQRNVALRTGSPLPANAQALR